MTIDCYCYYWMMMRNDATRSLLDVCCEWNLVQWNCWSIKTHHRKNKNHHRHHPLYCCFLLPLLDQSDSSCYSWAQSRRQCRPIVEKEQECDVLVRVEFTTSAFLIQEKVIIIYIPILEMSFPFSPMPLSHSSWASFSSWNSGAPNHCHQHYY